MSNPFLQKITTVFNTIPFEEIKLEHFKPAIEKGIEEVVAYALSLSGRKVDASLAEKGQPRFAVCVACHGPEGKGNQALGAPNLTDNIWLYGASTKAVTETLTNGRAGVMPPWKDILGEEKVHLISAYVYSLSQD